MFICPEFPLQDILYATLLNQALPVECLELEMDQQLGRDNQFSQVMHL